MDKINNILKDLEFEEREIKIYLALLQSGDLTALSISKKANIDRTTTYDILERLIAKGFVSLYIKNGSKHFSSLTPDKLLNFFKEKYSSLEGIIPELKKMSNKNSESVKCELFYGKEGLKSVGKDLINNAKKYYVIGMKKNYEDMLGYFNEQAIAKLDKFKAKEFAIVEKNADFKKLKNGQYKYLDKRLISPSTTLIYNNIILFFIWMEPLAVIRIENKTLAKAQREYFDMLWEIAK